MDSLSWSIEVKDLYHPGSSSRWHIFEETILCTWTRILYLITLKSNNKASFGMAFAAFDVPSKSEKQRKARPHEPFSVHKTPFSHCIRWAPPLLARFCFPNSNGEAVPNGPLNEVEYVILMIRLHMHSGGAYASLIRSSFASLLYT